jgi:hypothetical protein
MDGAADQRTHAALTDALDAQRQHVLGILEGLEASQLRAAVLPSGWSPLGLVNHLALDVEHYWFRCIVGGESLRFFDGDDEDPASQWKVPDDVDPEVVLARYREEIAAADEVLARSALDAPPAQRDDWWGTWDVPDVRFVLLHVVTETACHAGHLDAVRELIDGRQWVTL